PDVRSRIRYITSLTEQAANTVLNSTEKVQDDLSALKRANQNLAEKINALSEDGQGRVLLPAGLLDEIKGFHNGFKEKIKPVDQAMIEIITAQSFQDLTGQVSGKLTVLIERVEQELLQVLSDNVPEGKGHWQEPEPEGDAALLNGPAVEPADDTTVQNQQQVDDLLAKLGF
ncbi:MAG: protein phosphatase CheZ, partial [Alcaligenaceae bacterium]|nr:protein phosphatase CheZ [Alcaligenaceae bacterium]